VPDVLPAPGNANVSTQNSHHDQPAGGHRAGPGATRPPITVAVLAHNARDELRGCLDAVLNQTYPPAEVVVIDNASTDQTPAFIRESYPRVRLVRSETNGGCSGGRNLQLREPTHRHVMVVDHDVVLNTRCLEELADAVTALPDASIWSPRVCYEQDPGVIQFDGVALHFIGEAVLTHPDTPVGPGLPDEPFTVPIAGGVAFLVDRDAALKIGGYDESFFFGKTDGDFSFRLNGAGHDIYTVPKAVVYHRMKPRGTRQLERQVRNRWSLILKSYAWRTLVLLAPALLFYELCLLGFMAVRGTPLTYLKSNFLVLRDLPAILRERKHVQRFKRRRDRDLLSGGRMNIRRDLVKNPAVRLAHQTIDAVLRVYWSCIRWLV
jgi:GT2 family glycosyltransferase